MTTSTTEAPMPTTPPSYQRRVGVRYMIGQCRPGGLVHLAAAHTTPCEHKPRGRHGPRPCVWRHSAAGLRAFTTLGFLRAVGPNPATRLPYDDEVLFALARLGVRPDRLCAGCFTETHRSEYTWHWDTLHATRTVTLSDGAAAVIAYAVAPTAERIIPDSTARFVPSLDSTRQVAVSGHADAVIAGLLAASDEHTDSGINHDGIYTHSATWDELHTTFPLSAYQAWGNSDPTPVEFVAAWEEARAAFPLARFAEWAMHDGELIGHYYDKDAGT